MADSMDSILPQNIFNFYNILQEYEKQIHIVEYRQFSNYQTIRQSLKDKPINVIFTDPSYECKIVPVDQWPQLNANWCQCFNKQIEIKGVLQFKKNANCKHQLMVNKQNQYYSLSDDSSVVFVRDPNKQVIPPNSKCPHWTTTTYEQSYSSFRSFAAEYKSCTSTETTTSWLPFISREKREKMKKHDYLVLLAQLLYSVANMGKKSISQHYVCLHIFYLYVFISYVVISK